MTRELDDHDPMGVKRSRIVWDGQVDGPDKVFQTFATDEAGIRAGAICLLSYQLQHGCKTVLDFITRFAPSSDKNPTAKYAAFVAAFMARALQRPIVAELGAVDLTDLRALETMAAAIIHFENGSDPIPTAVIRSACARALLHVQAAGAGRPLTAAPVNPPATGVP
jgi:hypothetical protein